MRRNAIKKILAEGGRVINGWAAIPNSYATEVYAHQGWDSVTVDLQHGPVGYQTAVTMLQAISTTDAVPMARVPWNDPALIMKLLDAGAYGLVCPMINTKAEAEAFVSAARYAPLGTRSFGPNRAVQYGGADYWQHANEEILLFAMIETTKALANLDDILAVPSLNGTYIGPSDLSLSMGAMPTLDPSDPQVLAAIETIRRKTQARGLIAGIHTDSPKTALKRYAEGFQLCTVLN
ncbi:MAG: HpcH/HpaI aldolase family protein, partial [Hyphomicrobiaceae bacterium]